MRVTYDFKTSEELKLKSDELSKTFRDNGNNLFKQLKIFDAVLAFNKSIAFAESQLNLALAYGNRSAAYFEAKLYAECLKSIKLAKESGYPAEKMEKLTVREQKCIKLLAEQQEDPAEDLWSYIKLSYPANKKIQWIIEDLEMRHTEKYGRGIYTKRDLKAGDIICIEESKIHLTNSEGYKCCNNCSKVNMMNLIPCLKTASLMFCSIECRKDFYQCVDLSANKFNKMAFIPKKIEAVFGNSNNVNEYLNQKPSTTIFDFDLSDKQDPNYWLNIHKCFLAAADCHVILQLMKNQYNAMDEKTLTINSKFLHNSVGVSHVDFTNTILNEDNLTSLTYQLTPFKFCFGTFRALLNHSCVPNVKLFWIDNIAVIYVQTPIKANEQLFIAYAGAYHEQLLYNRGEFLSKHGVPNCDCIACTQNLTLRDAHAENTVEMLKLAANGTFTSGVGSVKSGMKRIAKLFGILNKYTNPLSLERVTAAEAINIVYGILADRSIFPVL